MKHLLTAGLAIIMLASCATMKLDLSGAKDFFRETASAAITTEKTPVTESTEKAKEPAQEPVKQASTIPDRITIIDAIKAYDVETLEQLLKDVEDIKTIVNEDDLLLHMAEEAMGYAGQPNTLAELLVSKKAYVLQRDDKGQYFTAVLNAMEIGGSPREENAAMLLDSRRDLVNKALEKDDINQFRSVLEFQPADGWIVLDAARKGASSILAFLLESGADPSLTDRQGNTAMHIAVKYYADGETFRDKAASLSVMLENGADPDAVNKNRETPLISILKELQLDYYGKKGSPAELVSLLLKYGADPDYLNPNENRSVLEIAAGLKDLETVKALVNGGAAITEKVLANPAQDRKTMEYMLDRGENPAFIAQAVWGLEKEEDQTALIRKILDKGVPASSFNLTMFSSKPESARLLVDRGADPGVFLPEWIRNGMALEQISYLIEKGADPDSSNQEGMPALHIAVQKKNRKAAEMLLAAGADINKVNRYGKTPLDYCGNSQPEMAEFLAAAGAKKGSEL